MKDGSFVFRRTGDVSRCVFLVETEKSAESVVKELAEKKHLIDEGKLLTLSLHTYSGMLFLYYECVGCDVHPQELISDAKFSPMMDVFHYYRPESVDYWKRTVAGKPLCRVIYLNPDKVSSYIFWHFQLQEEFPGDGESRFMISILENMLFMYTETPDSGRHAGYEGVLKTKNTPESGWPEMMSEHFKPWPDGKGDEWRDCETLFFI